MGGAGLEQRSLIHRYGSDLGNKLDRNRFADRPGAGRRFGVLSDRARSNPPAPGADSD